MDRRVFLAALGFLAAPLAVEAQQAAKVSRIGLIGGSPPNSPGEATIGDPACLGEITNVLKGVGYPKRS